MLTVGTVAAAIAVVVVLERPCTSLARWIGKYTIASPCRMLGRWLVATYHK